MKNNHEVDGVPADPLENISSIQAESPQAETSTYSSNDLGERLMKLPIELKQMIIFSFTPKERRHLRLVNKAMLDAVDTCMSDVQKIDITFFSEGNSKVIMKTINPDNGAEKRHCHIAVSSSLPLLLNWAGAQIKTLKLTNSEWIYKNDDSSVSARYGIFEALNNENSCPKLTTLKFGMNQSLRDKSDVILSKLLNYITKRQLQVKATDHPTPFLDSLTLMISLKLVPCAKPSEHQLHRVKTCKVLQDILDQCHGLKELDVNELLVQRHLPITALRYPTTLTKLKEWRLGETPGDLSALVGNCSNLQFVNLKVGFPHDDADIHALASLSELRELTLMGHSMEEKAVRMTERCLAAFEDHPFGSSIARPWPYLKSITVSCYVDDNYVHLKYRLLLSGANCCITSLHVSWRQSWVGKCYVPCVEQLFKALNSGNGWPNLMELSINAWELYFCIADSLEMAKDREPQALKQRPDAYAEYFSTIRSSSGHIYDILNGLLAYVTKRQSAVRLGKPFLRSLSICRSRGDCFRLSCEHNTLPELHDELEWIHITLQQILDQCHGLEELYMESLEDSDVNPDNKKGKELMELVPLRFPTTLKKLNGVRLENIISD